VLLCTAASRLQIWLQLSCAVRQRTGMTGISPAEHRASPGGACLRNAARAGVRRPPLPVSRSTAALPDYGMGTAALPHAAEFRAIVPVSSMSREERPTMTS
jgi:hypothetical protein